MSAPTDSQLSAAIVRITNENWAANQRALLLSKLGATLRLELPEIAAILGGRKLLAFIQYQLEQDVKLVRHPDMTQIWGVVPSNVSGELPNLFRRDMPSDIQESHPRTRFSPVVWAAFSVPLPANYKRHFFLEPRLHFMDMPFEAGQQESAFEIPANLIVPRPSYASIEELQKRNMQIEGNLTQWAGGHGIDIKRLSFEAEWGRGRPSSRTTSQTALDVILKYLDDSDLRRIQMPLDIVKRLRDVSAE